MDAPSLMTELGRRIGHPDFALSPFGTAALQIDGDLVLNFEHDEDEQALLLYVELGTPPALGRGALFERLLQQALFGRGSGGGHLGLDGVRDELVLSRSLALDQTDGVAMEAAVAALVGAARRLRGAWAAPDEVGDEGEVPDPLPAPLPMSAMLRA